MLQAKSIKFALYHPPPSPQTSSPSVFHFSVNGAITRTVTSSGLWKTSQPCPLPDFPHPVVECIQSTLLLPVPLTLSLSLLLNWPPHLLLVPLLWSSSTPSAVGTVKNLIQRFSLNCFRGPPSSSRHRANLQRSIKALLDLTAAHISRLSPSRSLQFLNSAILNHLLLSGNTIHFPLDFPFFAPSLFFHPFSFSFLLFYLSLWNLFHINR